MVVVKLGRIFIHDLLSGLDGIVVLRAWHRIFVCGLGLIIRMLVDEQVLDSTGADGSLINIKARRKVAVFSDADLVQEIEGKVLAIVVQEVVGWSLFSHVEDGHLAWLVMEVNVLEGIRKRGVASQQ